MADRIFISYRRDDSKGEALALRKTLVGKLPQTADVFMDADGGIRAGDNFVRVLDERIAGADIVLALIGPRWVEATDAVGRRRLDVPDDFVRIELFAALKRGVPVLPVLLDDTRMPAEADLPDLLRLLATKQAVRVRHDRFDADCDGVVDAIRRLCAKPLRPGLSGGRAVLLAFGALAAGGILGPWAVHRSGLGTSLPYLNAAVAAVEQKYGDTLRQLEATHQKRLAGEQERARREMERAERALTERNAARQERDAVRDQLKQAELRHGEILAKQKRETEAQLKATAEKAARAEAETKEKHLRLEIANRELTEAAKENAALRAATKRGVDTLVQSRKELERSRRELWERLLAAWSKLPPNPKAAEECRSKNDHYEAIRSCTEAIALDANNLAAYGRRAFGLVQLGEYGLSIADASRVIAEDPKDQSGWRKQSFWNRGLAHAWTEAWDQAIADYSERIKIDQHPTMYRWRAEAYQHRNGPGDHERFIADLRLVAENEKMPVKERDLARSKLRELGERP